jgi:hypothetical protein
MLSAMRCVRGQGGEQISYIGGLYWYPNNFVRFMLDGAATQVPAEQTRTVASMSARPAAAALSSWARSVSPCYAQVGR